MEQRFSHPTDADGAASSNTGSGGDLESCVGMIVMRATRVCLPYPVLRTSSLGIPVVTRCAYLEIIWSRGLVETVQMERQYGHDWRIPAGCGPASKRLFSPRRSSREVQRREKFALAVVPNTTASNLAEILKPR